MFIIGTIFMTLPPVFIALYILINYFVPGKKSVCVLVLGDVGRSPRMQYHALSFVESGFSVDIVGYGGSEVQDGLRDNEKVCIHYMSEPPAVLKYFPRLLVYVCKVIWQSLSLGLTLLLMPKCGYLLMQNPPCLPTMAVAITVCYLRGSRLVIDWHNYGYTIMGLTLGYNNPVVRFAKWYEHMFGRFSSSNICVTEAMQADLRDNWSIKASVMYDRPPEMFKETDLLDRHKLFLSLAEKYPAFRAKNESSGRDETKFTVANENGEVSYIQIRPALIVSSTSWTEDEDFGVLLSALEAYEKEINCKSNSLPDVVCVITGKGPLKEYYKEKIESQIWVHVSFCLPWLSIEDYPKLLGSADLGVCLHKSSSGLDLPMKVVDMYGCGLPVCAIQFQCLHELVKHEENGLIFKDSDELTESIKTLLMHFPQDSRKLETFRKNLTEFQSTRWQESWEKSVLPLFTDCDNDRKDR